MSKRSNKVKVPLTEGWQHVYFSKKSWAVFKHRCEEAGKAQRVTFYFEGKEYTVTFAKQFIELNGFKFR